MIDLHCHILPRLDDGPETLEESLEMARVAQSDGVRVIVATPHLFRHGYASIDFVSIQERSRDLNEALRKNEIALEIKRGAEVYICHDIIDEIKRYRRELVINESRYMFIELPSNHVYPGIKNVIFNLLTEGITPIIAHPERNSVLIKNPALLYEFVRAGALAQGNAGSLTGLYGRESQQAAMRFLGWRLIHFLASDGHNAHSLPPRLSAAIRLAGAVIGEELASSLATENPRAVLEDRELPALPVPQSPAQSRRSLFILNSLFLRPRR